MKPLLLSAYTATTCLGVGLDAHRAALREDRSGLQPCAFETVDLPTWVGEVAGVDDHPLPAPLAALAQATARHAGAHRSARMAPWCSNACGAV